MTGRSATRHDKSTFQKWFGPNRGTHWTVAGAVALIVLGSYVIYSNRDTGPTMVITGSAVPAPPATPAR